MRRNRLPEDTQTNITCNTPECMKCQLSGKCDRPKCGKESFLLEIFPVYELHGQYSGKRRKRKIDHKIIQTKILNCYIIANYYVRIFPVEIMTSLYS